MTHNFLTSNLTGNPIAWATLALALFCYILLFNLLLAERNPQWRQHVAIWLKVLPVLLSALPLLGLLGTIAGLLTTFRSMSDPGGIDQQSLLSGGIADALITTQLGLICVIPGLILLTWTRYLYRRSNPP